MARKFKTKPTGRPKKDVDFNIVEELCRVQCTIYEIESIINTNRDTIDARCQERFGIPFSEFYAQKRHDGHASLRRRVWQRVEDGSDTMIIWATKNYLGMTDRQEVNNNVNMSWTDLEKAAEEYEKNEED